MASSDMLKSGRLSARSNFSQTCTRLSRYLKEKGSFGDINLSFDQSLESKGAPKQTMDLLPTIEKSNADASLLHFEAPKKSDLCVAKSAAEAAPPMTIFYGGKVIVFNDLPPNKASEIISMAQKSSAAVPEPAPIAPKITAALHPAPPSADSDLPIARKNSLTRFLEKRKDRITASAPYPTVNKAPAAKPVVKTEPWLGLSSPQLSLH